jgi:hypothetical protein
MDAQPLIVLLRDITAINNPITLRLSMRIID